MIMGKAISIALGIFVLISLYLIHDESEKIDSPNVQLRKAMLIFCIVTSLLIGFLINLNF